MAEDELSACSVSSQANLLSLPSPFPFIRCLGIGGRNWHVESQEFGPWVKTPVSTMFFVPWLLRLTNHIAHLVKLEYQINC
jgi:hypothetical protein